MKIPSAVVVILTLCTMRSWSEEKVEAKGEKPLLAPTLRLGEERMKSEEWADRFARQIMTAKGGLGQIDSQFFVVLSGDGRNEIRRTGAKSWTGLAAGQRQVVYIFRGDVYEGTNLPKDFNLAKATMVSFEGQMIRILDLHDFSGGIYLRNELLR